MGDVLNTSGILREGARELEELSGLVAEGRVRGVAMAIVTVDRDGAHGVSYQWFYDDVEPVFMIGAAACLRDTMSANFHTRNFDEEQ